MSSLRRNTAAWLALAAVALNAAWPLLANAQPADPSAEICSANGGNHAGGAPTTPDKSYHASHCNLCPFGTERAAGIPALPGTLQLPVSAPGRVLPRSAVPQPQLALYPAAPPRAPPVLS